MNVHQFLDGKHKVDVLATIVVSGNKGTQVYRIAR